MKKYKYLATACILGSITAISYCLAQAVQKNHPGQSRQTNAIRQPFDPAREIRDQKYEQLLEQGDKAISTDPEAAETYYREATVVYPYPTDAWKGLGKALDALGKTTQALMAYHQAFESPAGLGEYSTFPSDIETLARYGTLCENAGQHDAALSACNRASERMNPKPTVPLAVAADRPVASAELCARLEDVRGIALDEQGKRNDALAAFSHASNLQPNDARVQFYLGRGLRKAGQFAAAQAAFQKAAQLDTAGTVKAATVENIRAVQAQRR